MQRAYAKNVPGNKEERFFGCVAERGAVDGSLDVGILGHEAEELLDAPQAARHAPQGVANHLVRHKGGGEGGVFMRRCACWSVY